MESVDKFNSAGTPLSELTIDKALVRNLLSEQHSDLMNLPISFLDAGWDNMMFRLGDRLLVRLPRREAAAKLIENEQIWLPLLAKQLKISVPTPIKIGQPTLNYPWRWSILPWIDGVAADLAEPKIDRTKLFASFLNSLHVPAPIDAPANPVRGIPLQQRAFSVEQRMQRLEKKTNAIDRTIKSIWLKALDAPIDVEAKWLHGDLHPRNILIKDGEITGIIDWGDLTSGDIATDLASIWMLFSQQKARQQVIAEYGKVSEATLQRAKGWAILFGVILLDTGLIDNPRHAILGEKILNRVAENTP